MQSSYCLHVITTPSFILTISLPHYFFGAITETKKTMFYNQNLTNWRLHFGFQSVMVGILIVISALTIVITWSAYRKQTQLDSLQSQLSDFKKKASEYQLLSQKGQANGYVPLNANGTVPDKFLPDLPASVVINRGCWDASTNTPTLVSSVGTPGEMYTVCVEGNYTLNGESEWKQHDRVFFLGGFILAWVRLDGARMSLNDTHAPVGNEQSLVVDMEGPAMSTVKVVGTSTMNVTLDSVQGVINFERGPNSEFFNQTTLTSVGGGLSFVLNGIGPNLTMRGLETTAQIPQFMTITPDPHDIDISAEPPFINGVTDITLAGTDYTGIISVHPNYHMYYYIGLTIWFHSTFYEMQYTRSKVSWNIFTNSSTDPFVNILSYQDGQVGMVMSGSDPYTLYDPGCPCYFSFPPFSTTEGARNGTVIEGLGSSGKFATGPLIRPKAAQTFTIDLVAPVFHGST